MTWALSILCVLVFLQIVVKVVIFSRVIHVLSRADALLSMTEKHAELTDTRTERLNLAVREVAGDTTRAASAAVVVATEVKAAVDAVPDKVVERLKSSESDTTMPTVRNLPPETKP